jgi:acyl-CoA synthetase (AMP-forming)/AMP-acid ligase II/acyl carrier protein
VFLSGDWIPVTLPDAVRSAFPNAQVIGLGGATEATIWSNFYPVGHVPPEWVSIPYGKPIQNASYYILNSCLEPCPVGVPGDLYIGGECLCSGYANEPELTASKFLPDPFGGQPGSRIYRTGDLARFFRDGNIEFLGRIDHQVKIRGFRIELGEVESSLAQHPGVRESVVMAWGEKRGEKTLVAYVVPTAEGGPTVTDLRTFLRDKLPEYMVPSFFLMLDQIPLTANGKVDRRALPAPDNARPGLEESFVGPRTPIEKALVEIWTDVLGINRIGVNDSFFDLGGHSMLATQLVSRARQAFKVNFPLQRLFSAPTIFSMALTIEEAMIAEMEDLPEAVAQMLTGL